MGGHSAGAPRSAVGAIIVAAGSSRRMGGTDKMLVDLEGRPLLLWSVEVMESCPEVGHVVLVAGRGQHLWDVGRLLDAHPHWRKVRTVTVGGPRRQDSVHNGLKVLPPCDWVVVHDGARPLVEPQLISRGLEAAGETGAAIAAVPMSDTVKVVSADRRVQSTLDRATLWQVQTPQIFKRTLLERAHRRVPEDVTDDAAMVERLGLPVTVYMGSYRNLKVTTPDDLRVAAALLAEQDRR